MTRVLMTADTLGGIWSYAIELICALPEVEFALCTMGAPVSQSQYEDVAALDNARLYSADYRLEWMDEPWSEVDAAGHWLLKIAERFQPDLIHLNGYSHAVLPWRVPVVVVAHSCILSWWRAVKAEPAPSRFDRYRERVACALTQADMVIAPSRAMLQSLRDNYDVAFSGRVIANGCAAPSSQVGKQAKILAAGRIWDAAKNLLSLDSIAPGVAWPIEIAGDPLAPDGHNVLLYYARPLGKLNRAQMAAALGHAAIFASPARYEPFGLSILEAALSGCALVLGNIRSLREVWEGSALFIDPEDHVALAGSLNRLIADQNLLTGLTRRSQRRARDFSATKMATQYGAAYRDLIDAQFPEPQFVGVASGGGMVGF